MTTSELEAKVNRLELAIGQVGLALKQTSGFRPVSHGRYGRPYTELAELTDAADIAARTGAMETRPDRSHESRRAA